MPSRVATWGGRVMRQIRPRARNVKDRVANCARVRDACLSLLTPPLQCWMDSSPTLSKRGGGRSVARSGSVQVTAERVASGEFPEDARRLLYQLFLRTIPPLLSTTGEAQRVRWHGGRGAVRGGAGEPGAAETEGVIETEATAEATTNEPAEARLLAWANARAMDVRGWPWREHHMESLSDPLIAHGRLLLAVAASVAPDCVAYEHVQDSQSEGSSGGGGGGGGGGDGGCDPAARRRNACYALSVAWRAGLPLGASYSDITAGKPSIIAMYLGLFARLAAGTDG